MSDKDKECDFSFKNMDLLQFLSLAKSSNEIYNVDYHSYFNPDIDKDHDLSAARFLTTNIYQILLNIDEFKRVRDSIFCYSEIFLYPGVNREVVYYNSLGSYHTNTTTPGSMYIFTKTKTQLTCQQCHCKIDQYYFRNTNTKHDALCLGCHLEPLTHNGLNIMQDFEKQGNYSCSMCRRSITHKERYIFYN